MDTRKFDMIVIKNHGFRKSPKDSQETDIVITDEKVIKEFTKHLALYILSDDGVFPSIKVDHPALKDKKSKTIGVNKEKNAIVIFV